jgi:hypothetical protein
VLSEANSDLEEYNDLLENKPKSFGESIWLVIKGALGLETQEEEIKIEVAEDKKSVKSRIRNSSSDSDYEDIDLDDD